MLERKKQTGVTFIGFILACIIILVFVYVGMRLWPILNEKLKIDAAIQSVSARDDISSLSSRAIGRYMLRSFEVEDVDRFESLGDLQNILVIKKVKGKKQRELRMNYEIRRPILGQFSVIYTYDNLVTIDGIGR